MGHGAMTVSITSMTHCSQKIGHCTNMHTYIYNALHLDNQPVVFGVMLSEAACVMAGVEFDQLQAEEQPGGPHRLHQHRHCLT